MKTLKLTVKKCEDSAFIDKKAENYGNAFLRLYTRFEESVDGNFIKKLMSDFGMNAREYRYLSIDVKGALDAEEKRQEQLSERIEDYIFELNDEKSSGKERFNAFRKIAQLTRSQKRNRTWGGLSNIRCLSKECSKENRDEQKISSIRKDIYQSRYPGVYYVGSASDSGNMNFDFINLEKGIIKYKPHKGKKIEITFYGAYKYEKELIALREMAAAQLIPITVRVSSHHIYITYDEEILSGYAVDVKARKKEYADVKSLNLPEEDEKAAIKQVILKYYEEQRNRMLVGKIPGRVFAIDLNPKYIGWAVLEADGGGSYVVIASGMYDLSFLSKKLGKKSSSSVQKKQNNKRKYEIYRLLGKMFKKAAHYKCSVFVCEDLEFKTKDKVQSELMREVRRQTRNIWHRTLIMDGVKKHCHERGIELRMVNPYLSSFIGNIQHELVDPANAAIEIGRRGLYKYVKGSSILPTMTARDFETLVSVYSKMGYTERDLRDKIGCNWVLAYKFGKSLENRSGDFSRRYRTKLRNLPVTAR